jgi:hypothetical protein
MAALKNFVIMLDDLLEVHLHHWPISAENDTILVLQELRQHDGSSKLVPRGEAHMELLENKALFNSQTGRVDHGAIYRVR